MALTDMTDLLGHAHQHGYAVGAFQIQDLAALSGVVAAAEASRAPLVLSPEASDEARLELLMPAVETAARRARVPVAIAVPVAAEPEAVARAIRLGANGLCVEAPADSFPRSVQQVAAVAATARECGLYVAAAPGRETVNTATEARRFVERSDIDGLRPDLGLGDGEGKGRPDYARLKQIHQALDTPLSVHAGAGLTAEQYRRLIRHGVAAFGYRPAPAASAEAVATDSEHLLRQWGAAGRAAEVAAQCRAWETAEQFLLCNLAEAADTDSATALAHGEQTLAAIPGVREAVGAHTTSTDAPYSHAWRVRLCHPAAVTRLQNHPATADCYGIHYFRAGGSPGEPAPRPLAPAPDEAAATKVAPLFPDSRRDRA